MRLAKEQVDSVSRDIQSCNDPVNTQHVEFGRSAQNKRVTAYGYPYLMTELKCNGLHLIKSEFYLPVGINIHSILTCIRKESFEKLKVSIGNY